MFGRCVPSVCKGFNLCGLNVVVVANVPILHLVCHEFVHTFINYDPFLLILFPILRGAKCQYHLGRMVDQIGVVLWHGMAWHGIAMHCMAWHGMACLSVGRSL